MSSYDQNLLDEAPRATRAQLQEGYSVDLLEDRPRRSLSMRKPATPAPTAAIVPLTPGIAETGSREKISSATPASRLSFWRTRNGIITIVIIALVIIGAVVGGAVGGTAGKNSSNNLEGSTGSSGADTSVLTPPSTTSAPLLSVPSITSSAGNQGVGAGGGASQVGSTSPTTSAPETLQTPGLGEGIMADPRSNAEIIVD
ncbi:hypothetical protein PAXRUDRAFT_823935 [Paxillus rubicundulus Ve08.2h10]|uniref:Uncharacterized protein n=1 Tax=Paxillus rubicundulus Ve08.2h10 TaxID=930991 RepID=A0A0D0DJ44_9AGAM|nr:hypothetical protein PAXRUDRAFT_823935 [Paxillus rubicundulus Ve08.2h10]